MQCIYISGSTNHENWIDGNIGHWDSKNQNWSRNNNDMTVTLKVLNNLKNIKLEFMNENPLQNKSSLDQPISICSDLNSAMKLENCIITDHFTYTDLRWLVYTLNMPQLYLLHRWLGYEPNVTNLLYGKAEGLAILTAILIDLKFCKITIVTDALTHIKDLRRTKYLKAHNGDFFNEKADNLSKVGANHNTF
ncbi:hypothetical protein RhiirC2_781199 [Rhizophagus irregularis]|uniref:RNase H type-1 domain-containing protein n=1 Tax=Rhizophagus irregularis TaxID=588596 RepID=A0A2N1N5W3_9GLOM|nr:hypothetical protein RhiirC2_781199 [Rhizophagus irregularis]